jgi:CTP:molybdopterin cytidylyltransferase MocA
MDEDGAAMTSAGRAGADARAAGILLAAGAGSRMGRPKALVDDWLARAARLQMAAGLDPVVVVLGARADEALARLPGDPRVVPVVAREWASGQSASLRAGLRWLAAHADGVVGAVVSLVDLPRMRVEAFERVLDVARGAVDPAGALVRARHAEGPGHPVWLGRAHWAAIVAGAHGDEGARGHLATHPVRWADCRDLACGRDVDRRPGHQLPR